MIPAIVANIANATNKTIVYSTRSANPIANTEIIVALLGFALIAGMYYKYVAVRNIKKRRR